MKKLLLSLAMIGAGILPGQAQPYLKQVITYSLTGYSGPETLTHTATSTTFRAKTFRATDKTLCAAIAADNGLKFKAPQLIKLLDLQGGFIGYYVMDLNKIVADATPYFARTDHDLLVHSGTDVVNTRTFIHTQAETVYAVDAWSIGLLHITGMSTSTVRLTYPDVDIGSGGYSTLSYSATVSGGFSDEDSGAYGVCTGTIRAISSVVKTAIPGL